MITEPEKKEELMGFFVFLIFLGMHQSEREVLNTGVNIILTMLSDNSGMESAKEITEEFVITTFNSLDWNAWEKYGILN